MSDRLYVKDPLFPLTGIAVAVFTFAFGLAMAKSPSVFFFLGGIWLLLMLFGYLRPCLAVLPAAALLCGIFCALTYAITGTYKPFSGGVTVRFGTPFYASDDLTAANRELYNRIAALLRRSMEPTVLAQKQFTEFDEWSIGHDKTS